MKKALLLGTVLCVSLGITACSKVQNEEELKANKEKQIEEKFLTDEKIQEISKNVKYKFGKVLGIQCTKIEAALASAKTMNKLK